MWHEARKQEKKIRGLLVDYKRRAERRKEYYERIKLDPTQFIQLHGRSCKIHLDPAVHHAAEAPGSMMPWRGNSECMIDRFDVRAHLDEIPQASHSSKSPEPLLDDRNANYERYRILVQNEFLDIPEEKFLHQIRLEELYGPVINKNVEEEKKLLAPKKAAIAFSYDNTPADSNETDSLDGIQIQADRDDESDDSDSDLDLDLTVDIVSLNAKQYGELNTRGIDYGMQTTDFMSLMQKDLDEAEALRLAKEHEDEKAMYSGRKSRKERRAFKKKNLDRRLSPPSYAARSSPTYAPYHRSSSRSRSPSPPTSQIKFITSFGGESEGGSSEDKSHNSHPERKRQSPGRRSGSSRHHQSHRRSRSPAFSRGYRKFEQRKDTVRSKRSPDHKSFCSFRNRDSGKSTSCHSPPRSSKYAKSLHSSKSSKWSDTVSKQPSPPVRRYYGRRGNQSESDDQDSDGSNKQINLASASPLSSGGSESTGSENALSKPTPQELLRRKMQVLLKKQYKEDKKMQKEKAQKAQQERQDREEELRGISIKMRRRERERRHRMMDASDSDSDSRSPSPRRWHESDERKSKERENPRDRRAEDYKDDYRYRETDRDRKDGYRRYNKPNTDQDESGGSRYDSSHARLVDY